MDEEVDPQPTIGHDFISRKKKKKKLQVLFVDPLMGSHFKLCITLRTAPCLYLHVLYCIGDSGRPPELRSAPGFFPLGILFIFFLATVKSTKGSVGFSFWFCKNTLRGLWMYFINKRFIDWLIGSFFFQVSWQICIIITDWSCGWEASRWRVASPSRYTHGRQTSWLIRREIKPVKYHNCSRIWGHGFYI